MELNPAFASDDAAANGADDRDYPANSEKAPLRPTKNLDPSGDVVLVLGETCLRVSSKVLSVASSVFRVMFGPHFQEGESISKRYYILCLVIYTI
jgi:hypothetical protein